MKKYGKSPRLSGDDYKAALQETTKTFRSRLVGLTTERSSYGD